MNDALAPAHTRQIRSTVGKRIVFNMKPLELTDTNFNDEIASGLTLVDFWAPWCGPCRIIAPVIEELAGQYEGRVKIGKVNVDENPVTQGQYRVMSIPTLILFKDGQPVEGVVGAQPKRAFETLLDKHIGTAQATSGNTAVSAN